MSDECTVYHASPQLLIHQSIQLLLVIAVFSIALSSTMVASAYSIGTPGVPWGTPEKKQWRDSRIMQRSYQEEVVSKILNLQERYDVGTYGSLSLDPQKYVLYYVKSKNWSDTKPFVLITGGVHGYETSGVQGAILFLQTKAEAWSEHFNILVCPCLAPWGYETIQRWNTEAVDPNRSFNPEGEIIKERSFNPEASTEESRALLKLINDDLGVKNWLFHIDLHETTDTDDTEFRPAKAARDGIKEPPNEEIPDGFYLVHQPGTGRDSQGDFFHAMIQAVKKVTHIAPTDTDGKIIGEPICQEGVIVIPATFKQLGLCAGMTDAKYATLTEVYPDSPTATSDICDKAQVACIEGALEYIHKHG